jgi:hypothetical protein
LGVAAGLPATALVDRVLDGGAFSSSDNPEILLREPAGFNLLLLVAAGLLARSFDEPEDFALAPLFGPTREI